MEVSGYSHALATVRTQKRAKVAHFIGGLVVLKN